MSDGIFYNQEVTSDDINHIAIDLGNTSFNGFGAEKFGADELNSITRDLVSAGILISDDRCRPEISGSNLIINTGTIVFANGAKKTISEPLVIPLSVTGGYVYALNNIMAGTCEIVVTGTAPDDSIGDYVEICQFNSSGITMDKRIYCAAKVDFPTTSEFLTGRATTQPTIIASSDWERYNNILLSSNDLTSTKKEAITTNRYLSKTRIKLDGSETYFPYADTSRHVRFTMLENGDIEIKATSTTCYYMLF